MNKRGQLHKDLNIPPKRFRVLKETHILKRDRTYLLISQNEISVKKYSYAIEIDKTDYNSHPTTIYWTVFMSMEDINTLIEDGKIKVIK